jgi:hypothetical protein
MGFCGAGDFFMQYKIKCVISEFTHCKKPFTMHIGGVVLRNASYTRYTLQHPATPSKFNKPNGAIKPLQHITV